ncbi:MAG: FixH family protein [Mesorhizobium sp.]
MKLTRNVLALAALGTLVMANSALAGAADYEFQLVDTQVRQSNAAVVAVRLIDKRSGKPVPGAVIFATRMDMAPDGMEMMATTVEPAPSEEPGVYRFKANLGMAGGWQFSVAAKVQGEPETVEAKLVLKAVQ